MPTNKISPQKLQKLRLIEQTLTHYIAGELSEGEPFHGDYRKDPKIFKQLITSTISMKRAMHKFLRNQQERLNQLVHLHLIADDSSDWINDDNWDDEDQNLAQTLEPAASSLYNLGIAAAQKQYGVDLGLGQDSSPQAKFLQNYLIPVASDINDTTKKWLTDQIKTSIALGESKDQLIERLNDTLDNVSRARTIAQTESIRSFAQGRLDVGKEIGITTKEWDTTFDPCPECADLDGEQVDINDTFSNGDDAPPAHPNCRCSIQLITD